MADDLTTTDDDWPEPELDELTPCDQLGAGHELDAFSTTDSLSDTLDLPDWADDEDDE